MRPVEMLTALGLFEKADGEPKLTAQDMKEFAERKKAFEWVHLGTVDLPHRKLFEVLRSQPELLAPRTGHLGNWTDIANGRAGAVDYNLAICGDRALGYPLIFEFNLTEDASLSEGDWIYLPGSLVAQGERVVLPLFTWDGANFSQRTREHPRFTPLVKTSVDGQLVPLSSVHRKNCTRLSAFHFRYESSMVRRNEALLREILHSLIEDARQAPEPQSVLNRLIDRAVTLDGRVFRSAAQFDDPGFLVGETRYDTMATLIDAIMLPYLAADEPDAFFAGIAGYPRTLPLLSNALAGLFAPMFNAHYPEGPIDRERMTQPCNPHFQWGAIGMAGYPPRKVGYFSTNARYARKFHKRIVDRFPQIDPILFLLLPAANFTLLPSAARPRDSELLADLFYAVHTETASYVGDGKRLSEEIDRVVEKWVNAVRDEVSPYFVNRFASRRSVLNKVDLPEQTELVEPPGFDALTVRQGAMIVGALIETFNRA